MKLPYNFFHRSISFVMILGMLLQSCVSNPMPSIPMEKNSKPNNVISSSHPANNIQEGKTALIPIDYLEKEKEKETDKKQLANVDLASYQHLYEFAVQGNDPEAQFQLGKRAYKIWQEQGTEEAVHEAIEWLNKAANQEHEGALALLKELAETKFSKQYDMPSKLVCGNGYEEEKDLKSRRVDKENIKKYRRGEQNGIALFKEPEFQKGLFKVLPANYELGEISNQADSFFESLTISMNSLKGTEYTGKNLRGECYEFYETNQGLVNKWNQEVGGKGDGDKYDYEKVQFTFEECKDWWQGEGFIQGTPAVEGRILCRQLNLPGICFLEATKNLVSEECSLDFYFTNKEDCKHINKEDAQKLMQEGNIPIIVNVGESFIPLVDSTKNNLPRLILSLDGGGIRGIMQAYALKQLEERVEKKIKKQDKIKSMDAPTPDLRLGECFDLIGGTSGGGIIALMMRIMDPSTNRPRFKMEEIVGFFEKYGNDIFPTFSWFSWLAGRLGSTSDPRSLDEPLEEYFNRTTLQDLSKPTIVTGYDAGQQHLYLFRSYEARDKSSHNFILRDVARATSAAPTYFPGAAIKSIQGEEYHFVDGGLAANNPSFYAYKEAKNELYPYSRFCIISLGSGTFPLSYIKKDEELPQDEEKIARDISAIAVNSSNKLAEDLTYQLAKERGDIYTRLQFKLDTKDAKMDDTTPESISNLKAYIDYKFKYNDPSVIAIEKGLLKFYKTHNYYVFYPLVESACRQVKQTNGAVDLSRSYLEQEEMPYLTQRAMWEITHALSTTKSSVTFLNLSGNNFGSALLPKESLGYLKKLPSITSLDYTSTNLTIEDLTQLPLPQLLFPTFNDPISEETKEIDFDGLDNETKLQELSTSKYPLHDAVRVRDEVKINELLASEIALNTRDGNGNTPLHLTLELGYPEMAKLLIEKGADINVQDDDGNTPLHVAAERANKEIATLLIDKGANVSTENKCGNTLLHKAALGGSKEVTELLLKKGVNVEAVDQYGNTPLHKAAVGGNKEVVALLVKKGANVKVVDKSGNTPLHVAAARENKEVVELLIEKGADVKAVEQYGNTPLHKAAKAGFKEVIELLIKEGGEVNVQNEAGDISLHLAALGGDKEVVELLIDKGADVNVRNNGGSTPIHKAIARGSEEVVALLIQKGANINVRDEIEKNTPLHLAIENVNPAIVKLLLDQGADINALGGKADYTPLHMSAERGNKGVVELLIEKGADIKAVDEEDNTPLHKAAEGGYKDVVELLIEKGVDINTLSKMGNTPLHKAAAGGNKEVVELLIQKGADVKAVDKEGNSSLDLAVRRDNQELIKLLKDAMKGEKGGLQG